MEVAILGCGPAGLLAAHAVTKAGHRPVIFSRYEKSTISGAQFLHRPVEDATLPEEAFDITFQMSGDEAGYVSRLYRDHGQVDSSWKNYQDGERVVAYPMATTYDRLWSKYRSRIEEVDLDLGQIRRIYMDHPEVVSTIPRGYLASDDQASKFRSATVHIGVNDVYGMSLPENTIWYNGSNYDDGNDVYRASNIQGITSGEYVKPQDHTHPVVKPIRFEGVDEFPDIFKVGRYGRWDKRQLAHSAYSETLKWFRPDLEVQ